MNNYFDGNTDKKVMGSTSGFGNYGQQMRARGLRLYLGTEKLDKDGVQMAFTDNSSLFFQYKRAKKTSNAGWLTMLAGIGLGMGIICADIDDVNSTVIAAGGIVITGGIAGGIYMQISSRRKIKKVAKLYNDYQLNTAQLSPNSYQLGITINKGIGLRLTF